MATKSGTPGNQGDGNHGDDPKVVVDRDDPRTHFNVLSAKQSKSQMLASMDWEAMLEQRKREILQEKMERMQQLKVLPANGSEVITANGSEVIQANRSEVITANGSEVMNGHTQGRDFISLF